MRYVSVLRGINLGAHKKILMADLKDLYESLGFANVVTYIQTGNVSFDTRSRSPNALIKKVEAAIRKKYAFDVPVQLRTRAQLDEIVRGCPFAKVDADTAGTKVLVTFLASKPENKSLPIIRGYLQPREEVVVAGTCVYLHCPDGYATTKLSNNFLEKKLGVQATTRNWKTVLKLFELSAG